MGDRLQDVLKAFQMARARPRQDTAGQASAAQQQDQARKQPQPQKLLHTQASQPAYQQQPAPQGQPSAQTGAPQTAKAALPFELQVMQRMGVQSAWHDPAAGGAAALNAPPAAQAQPQAHTQAPQNAQQAQHSHHPRQHPYPHAQHGTHLDGVQSGGGAGYAAAGGANPAAGGGGGAAGPGSAQALLAPGSDDLAAVLSGLIQSRQQQQTAVEVMARQAQQQHHQQHYHQQQRHHHHHEQQLQGAELLGSRSWGGGLGSPTDPRQANLGRPLASPTDPRVIGDAGGGVALGAGAGGGQLSGALRLDPRVQHLQHQAPGLSQATLQQQQQQELLLKQINDQRMRQLYQQLTEQQQHQPQQHHQHPQQLGAQQLHPHQHWQQQQGQGGDAARRDSGEEVLDLTAEEDRDAGAEAAGGGLKRPLPASLAALGSVPASKRPANAGATAHQHTLGPQPVPPTAPPQTRLSERAPDAGDPRRPSPQEVQIELHLGLVRARLKEGSMPVGRGSALRPMMPEERVRFEEAAVQLEQQLRTLQRERQQPSVLQQAGPLAGGSGRGLQPQLQRPVVTTEAGQLAKQAGGARQGVSAAVATGGAVITGSNRGVLTGVGGGSALSGIVWGTTPTASVVTSGTAAISGSAGAAGSRSKPAAPSAVPDAGQNRVTEHQQALRAVIESLQVTGTEELEPPPKTLQVSVLLHQRMALAWMIRRETGPEPRGGILADDQGLGKTVTTISLIVTHTNPEDAARPGGLFAAAGGSGSSGAAAATASGRAGAPVPAGDPGAGAPPPARAEEAEEGEEEDEMVAEEEGEEDVDACGVRLGALRAEREAAGAADAAEAEGAAVDMSAWDGASDGGGGGGGAAAAALIGSGPAGIASTEPSGAVAVAAEGPAGAGPAGPVRVKGTDPWVGGDPRPAGSPVAHRSKPEPGLGDTAEVPQEGLVKAEDKVEGGTVGVKEEVKQEDGQSGAGPGPRSQGASQGAPAPETGAAAARGSPARDPGGSGLPSGSGRPPSPPLCVDLVDTDDDEDDDVYLGPPVPYDRHVAARQQQRRTSNGSPGSDPDILFIREAAPGTGRGGAAAPAGNLPAAAAGSLSQLASVNLAAASSSMTAALLAKHRQQIAAAAGAGAHSTHGKASLYEPEPPNLLLGGTLVVCPTSVLHQWAREIRDKVSPSAGLVVHVYHGKDRVSSVRQLAAMGVVLTTYGTLAQEAPSRDKQAVRLGRQGTSATPINLAADDSGGEEAGAAGGGIGKAGKVKRPRAKAPVVEGGGALYQIKWRRVVLDEAQSIKNPRTLAAHAAWRLFAHCRWCLSGTPIQNSVDDLYSYFRFLRYAPYCESRKFKELIKAKIVEKPEIGFKFLQAVLQAVLLRRTKQSTINGEPIIRLPGREQQLVKERFSPHEAAFYSQVQAESLRVFREAGAGGANGSRQYVNMLHQLLKLRQACNHPWLVRGARSWHKTGTPSAAEVEAARKLSPEARAALVGSLARGDAQCPCCGDIAEDPVASACGHVFCAQCLAAQREGASVDGELLCPACSRLLRGPDLHSAAALAASDPAAVYGRGPGGGGGGGDDGPGGGGAADWVSSAKVERLLSLLESIRAKNAGGSAQQAAGKGGPANPLAVKSKSDRRMAGALRKLPPLPGSAAAAAGPSAGGKPDKVIVFSQWTSMLDLLEIPLKKSKIYFRRLDGTMSVPHRERAIQDFESRPEVMVLLVSLKAAALGVNLTVANHVVLMDLWWNPTTEEQAIDRAHRIGQTRTVHVTRITIAGSVEDRILELQQAKRELVAAALSEGRDGSAAAGRLTLEDLRFLFQGLAQ